MAFEIIFQSDCKTNSKRCRVLSIIDLFFNYPRILYQIVMITNFTKYVQLNRIQTCSINTDGS